MDEEKRVPPRYHRTTLAGARPAAVLPWRTWLVAVSLVHSRVNVRVNVPSRQGKAMIFSHRFSPTSQRERKCWKLAARRVVHPDGIIILSEAEKSTIQSSWQRSFLAELSAFVSPRRVAWTPVSRLSFRVRRPCSDAVCRPQHESCSFALPKSSVPCPLAPFAFPLPFK